MNSQKIRANFNLRYNMLTVLVYFVGIILIIQLFNLQIINGAKYRESSNARLTRESVIEAARGNIEDRNNTILATTRTGYSVELYKTKSSNEQLNEVILKIINLLESNKDNYINNFPIDSNLKFTYTTEKSINNWKTKYKIPKEATVEECIQFFKEKYDIIQENIKDVLKIIAVRYEITTNGYSATKSIKIAKDISKKSAIQFNEQNSDFPGVNIIEEPIRVYTQGSLASHIIGYIRKVDDRDLQQRPNEGYDMNDDIGKMGIEYVLEKYLRGQEGKRQIDMSVDGTIEGEYIDKEAISGNTVVLTIDAELQEKMEKIIKDAVKELQKEGEKTENAAAVLMDIETGEVLAMCSYPSFEPQSFIGVLKTEVWADIQEKNKLYNHAVSATPPGSTFKMVTAAAALEEGIITESEYIYATGVYPYGHKPACWYYNQYRRGHGNVNIKTALQKSCNYFFYEMGRQLGVDTIAKYARYFMLGQKTGIEITGEQAGTVASTEYAESRGDTWYPSNVYSAAIGQSYNNYSPIQLARYISMIANGGNYVEPTLIRQVKDIQGNIISKEEIENYTNKLLGIQTEYNPEVEVTEETLNTIKAGMRLVTSSGGTAYSIFKDFKYSVAGKTGSAEASTIKKGDVANSWFVGFTPYENAEVAIAVFIEDGASNSSAAKAGKKILEAYYNTDIIESEKLEEDMSAQIYN